MKHILRTSLLLAFGLALISIGGKTQAQTTLAAGDIAFTGYNAAGSGNNFSFVILRSGGISNGTSISFTDIGWNPITSSLSSVGTDGLFTWTASSSLAQFTEVTIAVNTSGTSINSVSTGTASTPSGGSGTGTGFILSGSGDQILAFTGTQSSPTFIAAIQMNANVANGTSSASSLSTWDDIQSSGGWAYTANVSKIPPGLTNGTNAVMVVTGTSAPYTEYDYAKYNCTGASSSTSVSALAAAINDRANWSVTNSTGYTLPSGCSFAVTTLPLHLLAFTAQATDAGTRLSWSTANERDMSGFDIQRSEDGMNFSSAGFVAASAQGNYSYMDAAAPASAKLFYRLKMMDIGGSFTYSDIVVVRVGQNGTQPGKTVFSIYPNPVPANDKMYLIAQGKRVEAPVHLTLNDLTGKCVFRTVANPSELSQAYPVDISHLPAGAFVLTVIDNGTAQHISVVRQ